MFSLVYTKFPYFLLSMQLRSSAGDRVATGGYKQGKENLAEIHSLHPAQEPVTAFGATAVRVELNLMIPSRDKC